MCAIIGALLWNFDETRGVGQANDTLNEIFARSLERGRDGRGWLARQFATLSLIRLPERSASWDRHVRFFQEPNSIGSLVANLRAEPTTEHVQHKHMFDQQPYQCGPWTIVHNGTIANDHELRTHKLETRIDSAAIAELLDSDHTGKLGRKPLEDYFVKQVSKLKGSYAILATHEEHPDIMLVAANYRPVWYAYAEEGVYFASARHYFPKGFNPQMIPPYSVWSFSPAGKRELTAGRVVNRRALVVCSGGLDSVVAATAVWAEGYDIELLHFQYGSRAEGPEVGAVSSVAQALGVPYRLFPLPIYKPEDSPLLQADSKIAGGEAGAEFAHEWVPARNLAMLSVATALAEAGGFDHIVLGNNLEEAGAYPDNEPEFIARFNDLLPFAVADGKSVTVRMPVGNLMKHEIVALGHTLGAPLDKTWSCYRAGEQHCGTCGPCYMRRTAFAINNLPEVITYACEEQ